MPVHVLYKQFETAAGLNPKLNTSILSTLGKHFEEFVGLSKWIDSFDECLYINSNLKGLFFKQAVLFDHAKQILEEQGERLKYVIVIGMVASDFNDNASELWPYEVISSLDHTTNSVGTQPFYTYYLFCNRILLYDWPIQCNYSS